jgi:hypothetical protein
MPESSEQDCPNPANKTAGNGQPFLIGTESTTETTAISTAGAALKEWLSIKSELQELLDEQEWKLWVRPAYLLKLLSGGTMLVTLPPNKRILEAARARLPMLREIAGRHGYEGVVFSSYPDDYEREQIRTLHPEFYQQMLGNRTSEARREQR